MKSLKSIAADCLDAYNQDYLDDNETFFNLDYFLRQASDVYSALLEQEYQTAYAALRATNAHLTEYVSFDSIFLTKEKISIAKEKGDTGYWFAELKWRVYSFRFDQSSCGLQQIIPLKRGECNFVKTKAANEWADKYTPQSPIVFFYPWDCGIRLTSGCCNEATVMYIPAPHADLEIQDGFADGIKTKVLTDAFNWKRGGTPVDPSNNSQKQVTNDELTQEVK